MVSEPLAQRPLDLNPPRFIEKAAAALAGAVALTALIAFVFSAIYSLVYIGRIYPGVSVGGVDLSGVRRTDAVVMLSQQLTYPITGQVTLAYGGQNYNYSPAQLGLTLDADASARAAYSFGRSWLPWQALAEKVQSMRGGATLAPRLLFNGDVAQQTLMQVAAQLNRPTQEAQLSVTGLDVQMTPGQVGLTLDTERTASFLAVQLLGMQNVVVPLAVVEQPPRILDASAQAEIARGILSQPLVIAPGGNHAGAPEPWTLQPDQLAGMLTIERVEADNSAQYQVGLDAQKLGAFLAGLATQVAAGPENARFIFNDETAQLEVIQPAVIGRTLQIQKSIDSINQQIGQGAHQVELQYDFTNPELPDDVKAADLGITQLVAEQTTYFYGSSPERIQNIKTAAARFHGLLVPPGEVFSMVANIGDISLESGFAEALIIFGDRTIKGVGGGVCQVSTTLFRTVFFGGYPIIERYPHAYRVSYYEYNAAVQRDPALVGLDATVYAPVVDFKFQNDTPYWLLMETYVDEAARTITWKFYSTSDGRRVEYETSGPTDVEEAPDPVYEENPELSKGEVKHVDYAAEGATVRITRWVYRGDELISEDHINTKYEAWPDVYQYGKGTPNYPPKQVHGQNSND
jgi:vancomycin resistance protein YoaR